MCFLYCVKLLAVVLLFPLCIMAQQPSHYVLGEGALDGMDIYGILHASNGNYLIATNNGLVEFDGYRFQRINCTDMLMQSVFNLVEDRAGNIFYNNLSGQVFKLREGSCELFVNLPDSLVAADISLAVDDHDRLVISCMRLLMVTQAGKLQFLSESVFFGPLQVMPDGSLIVHSPSDQSFFRWKEGGLKKQDFGMETRPNEASSVITFKDSIYPYYTGSCELFRIDHGRAKLVLNPSAILGKEQLFKLHVADNALWFASSSLGIIRIDGNDWPKSEGAFIFPRTFISTVTEDAEGNILLGTFGKGIIVIPQETTQDLTLIESDDIISIAGSGNRKLFFGTRSGRLLERTEAGTVQLIRSSQVKSLEALFFLDTDKLLIGETNGVLLDLVSGAETALQVGSIKDVERISANEFLIASNGGAYRLNMEDKSADRISGLELRHYCIGYDPFTRSIYSGTSKGMMVRDREGNVRSIELLGKGVIVRDFQLMGDKLFAATSDHGLLVFRNDTLIGEWNTESGLISDQITQLHIYKDQLVVITIGGIQLLDENGTVLRTINQSDGLNSLKVIDLEIDGDELWVVHSSGVQKVMLNDGSPVSYRPSIMLSAIVVNDSVSVIADKHDFKYDQQKFTFELSSKTLRYRNEVKYLYRLEGAETGWNVATYSNNRIEYRSLSPGTYTFRAKTVFRGAESEEVSYRFTIATPFYRAWWFFLLISVFGVVVLFIWFRRRLKRQQLEATQQNELNASKLTAIQSQMNPHFIFNALNSIQSLVLKGDVDNSYTYITKFANLVRRTLNYSDKEFIDFSEEVKLIDLYLTLEKLRFKEDFSYEIRTNGVEYVLIPPMLIQPFIENALVHGLLHRNGAKWIRLEFELGEVLTCTISDNGVGREKAKLIKERQRSDHESFSVNAIRTRFEILQCYHDGALGFDYEDLTVDGEPAGTKVVLRIPVKRKF